MKKKKKKKKKKNILVKELTDAESFGTSMHVKPRQIFLVSLFAVSIVDGLFFLAAEGPIAFGRKKTQKVVSPFHSCIHS